MIEFQTAPKPDATDLRVMLEEERKTHEVELMRLRAIEDKRRSLEQEAKHAEQGFEEQRKLDRADKIAAHVLWGLTAVGIPVHFLVDDPLIQLASGGLGLLSIPAGIGLLVLWKIDETRKRKKLAIAARQRLEDFDIAQKEVTE